MWAKSVVDIKQQVKEIDREKIIYLLLFILPLFAVTKRHWISNTFVLLSLFSLYILFKKDRPKVPLLTEEKILIYGFYAYFFVYILTSLVNGWGKLQTEYLGVEIRYLLFVPIYLVIRQMPRATQWLMVGCIIGVIITSIDGAMYLFSEGEPRYRGDHTRYHGVYSPLFTGPITWLFAIILIPFFYEKTDHQFQKMLLIIVGVLGLYIAGITIARNALFSVIPLSILVALYVFKGAKKYFVIILAILLLVTACVYVDKINSRVGGVGKDVYSYLSIDNPAKINRSLGSVEIRLEMWRVTPMFFNDNPVFGIGRGNYSKEIRKYIDSGQVHSEIGNHSHPHNAFSEVIISRGIFGLIAYLWIVIVPLIILIRAYNTNIRSAFFGILLISAYLIFSLTDASSLIKGNYSSIYIVLLAVLYSYCMHEKRRINEPID